MRVVLVSACLSLMAEIAHAGCSLSNQSGISFTLRNGNTSNITLGGSTTTSVDVGVIVGVSNDKAHTIGGSCRAGDKLVVKLYDGVPALVPEGW